MEAQLNNNQDDSLSILKEAFDHFNQERFSQAAAMCDMVLAQQPENGEALNLMASCRYKSGNIEEAINCQEKTIELEPENVDFIKNIELFYRKAKRYDKAIDAAKKAISLSSDKASFYYCSGLSHCQLWQLEEALEVFEKTIRLDPYYVKGYVMLGNTLQELGRYEEAMQQFQKADSIEPNNPYVTYNKSLLQLLMGNFKDGFKGYEERWKQGGQLGLPEFVTGKPGWYGTKFGDKTLLLLMEQGHGDAIQFSRYIPQVQKFGKNIVIRCTSGLIDLLHPIAPDATWISYEDDVPEFDLYVSMLSLPKILDTELDNIPANIPYIAADNSLIDKWKPDVSEGNFKVGFCWSGSPNHPKDHKRSIEPEVFSTLFDAVPEVVFYSLQKGRDEEVAEKTAKEKQNVINIGSKIGDFADTAAIIDNLDLIISVDTAVVHLAGAMAKPVWNLLLFNADWRWLLEREDSPWYPTMRFFRQKTRDDWKSVLKRVAKDLKSKSRDSTTTD